MLTLNTNTLNHLPSDISKPQYDRKSINIGQVHIGLGAFHKGHQAIFTEAVLNQFGGNWAICGVSLRNTRARDELKPQDGLYTLSVQDNNNEDLTVIGAIQKILVAPEEPQAVIDQLAQPNVHVVTLTITEKGYCLNPATGELDFNHVDIQQDLQLNKAPITAIAYLCAAFKKRMLNNLAGLTVISCDNCTHNGKKLATAVNAFAEKTDPTLLGWIKQHVTFPSTMVDRIVPAVTSEDKHRISEKLGLHDNAGISTEPFCQWVIENNFASVIPPWADLIGDFNAELVADVAPFEEMKLRLLNGSHSTLAYLACLMDIETVADAIKVVEIRHVVSHLMENEMQPTLQLPDDFNIKAYIENLLIRFSNSALKHQTQQIAMDGSQKIPQRLLPAMKENLSNQRSITISCLAIAAWIRYTAGYSESNRCYKVDDPKAEKFVHLHQGYGNDTSQLVNEFIHMEEIFGANDKYSIEIKKQVIELLTSIVDVGCLATIKNLCQKYQ